MMDAKMKVIQFFSLHTSNNSNLTIKFSFKQCIYPSGGDLRVGGKDGAPGTFRIMQNGHMEKVLASQSSMFQLTRYYFA